MWFKNLVIFQFEQTPEFSDAILATALEQDRFKPCGPQQPTSLGWTSPMGDLSEQLYHTGSGNFLITARREERVLPATVVRQAVDQKVLEIELREDRKVGRKQKMEIRDELVFEMMPKAFTQSSRIDGMLLPQQKLLVVDTASRKKAEEWVSLLRQSLGTLPVRPVELMQSLPGLFTGWLSGKVNLPAQVEPLDECELQSPDESGAVIRCRRQDLSGSEIKAHLDAGKLVTRLAVDWNQDLSFIINQHAEIKRLRFSDTLVEQAASDGIADQATEFDARFALMSLELSRFLPALWEELGGLRQD